MGAVNATSTAIPAVSNHIIGMAHVDGAGDLNGEWCVNDRMNERWKHRIDFLVNTTRKTGYWKNVKLTLIEE